jgi:exodeoxyribonuclease VII small subunit
MANQPSFEDSLTKLEEIVEKMESGDLKLEDSLKLFEEGMKLTKDCNLRLSEIEKKVKLLLKSASSKEEGGSARGSKSKDE